MIVGAGVAGLATAVALERTGRAYTILERATTRSHHGYGVLLMPNGLAAIDRLGVGDQARDAGVLVTRRQDLLADGRVLGGRTLSPHLVLPRGELVGVLQQALPPGTVRTGTPVTGVSTVGDGSHVDVVLAEGSPVRAVLVIGADGAASRLRQAVDPRASPGPHRLGELLARVAAPHDVLDRLDGALHKWQDPDGGLAVGVAPAPDATLIVYLQVLPERWAAAGGDDADLLARATALVGGWPDPIPRLLERLEVEAASYEESADLDPLATFSRGRVVLVGDAAHPMLTLSTQGASTALEDALALVDALAATSDPVDDLPTVLTAYDEARIPVGHDRVERGRARFRAFLAATPRFDDTDVDRGLLRRRAYNHRWATQPADVIPMTAADPDFAIPPVVRETITDYVSRGPLSYGPPEGLPGFREAVADVLTERRGVPMGPEGVLATDSAASAMYVIARWLLSPGDEAIVFDPVDYLFVSSVEAAGATAVRCRLDPATGRVDPDRLSALITARTRMIGICNPHNPLGRVLDAEELVVLGELAVRHNLYLMNDEVWADVVHPPHNHHSIAAVAPEVAARTLTVGGFSKSFGLAGLRIGYLATTEPAVRTGLFTASQAESTAYGAATLSQVAAEAAYRHGWAWFAAFLQHLTRMRDLGVARLDAIHGITCTPPQGTFLLFPDITGLGVAAEVLVDRALQVGRVAIVPGTARWFGPGAQGHVRIAFATSEAILTEGLNRLEKAVASL